MDVIHDRDSRLFLFHEGEQRAFLYYERRNGALDVKSTFVPGPLRDRGVGRSLARAAAQYAAEQRLTLTASCSFVQRLLAAGQLKVDPGPPDE